MNKLSNDLSALTSLPPKIIEQLQNTVMFYICENMAEQLNEGKELIEIDMGIGTLYIKNTLEGIKCKFKPSTLLENTLSDTYQEGSNALDFNLNKALLKQIEELYEFLV